MVEREASDIGLPAATSNNAHKSHRIAIFGSIDGFLEGADQYERDDFIKN